MSKKFLLKLISGCAILSLTLSIPSLAIDNTNSNNNESQSSSLYTEVVSMREATKKVFKTDTGAYIAAVYDGPVHFQDIHGNWQNIDNRLVKTEVKINQIDKTVAINDSNIVSYLENTANDVTFRLPDQLSKQTPIQISTDKYTLSFTIADVQSSIDSYIVPQTTLEKNKKALQTLTADEQKKIEQTAALSVDNQKSVLEYSDVFPDVTAQYVINGQSLKENLILKTKPKLDRFSFVFTYEGLTAITYENGVVEFKPSDDLNGEPVYRISPPCMYDSGEGYSDEIEVEYQTTETGGIYSLIPDSDWLNAQERIYPVTLDPSIGAGTSQVSTNIIDDGVTESDPNKNYYAYDRMYVGSNLVGSSGKNCWAYIRFRNFNTVLPANVYVDSAYLNLYHYPTASYQTATNKTMHVYRVKTAWPEKNITWNNKPSYEPTLMATFKSDKSNSIDSVDVRNLVTQWNKERVSDAMLVIKPDAVDNSKTNRTCFYTSDCGASISFKRPKIEIKYYPAQETQGITSGKVYYIKNKNSGMSMDADKGTYNYNVLQYSFHGNSNQAWKVIYDGNGLYRIQNMNPIYNSDEKSKRCFLSVGEGSSDNADLFWSSTQKGVLGYETQRFRIIPNGDGSYRLACLYNEVYNNVIEVAGASTSLSGNVRRYPWNGTNCQRWYFEEPEYGNGGSYRQVNTSTPNCFGYALFSSGKIEINTLFWPNSHKTVDFADRFEGAIEGAGKQCRRIDSFTSPIEPNEYRVAIRCPNLLDGIHRYHVIYQLSDGTWAGKDDTRMSQHFNEFTNPDFTPSMWSNDAYAEEAGTIYFAVRR